MRFGLIVSANMLSLCFVAGAALAQEPVPAPTLKVGDSWTYIDDDKMDRARGAVKVIETITVVSEKGFETSVAGDPRESGQRRYTSELNTLRALGFDFEPMIPNYSFPLAVGKRWEGRYSFFNPSIGSRMDASQQAKVEGWEEVKVPAGTFKALRITIARSLDFANRRGDRITRQVNQTIWYSPEVRWFVRREITSPAFQDQTAELVEFKRAP